MSAPGHRFGATWEAIAANPDKRAAMFSVLNPENEAATREKLLFWKQVLEEWLETKGDFAFATAGLERGFSIDGLAPLCLDGVLAELQRAGALLPSTQIKPWKTLAQHQTAPPGASRSLLSALAAPLFWLGSYLTGSPKVLEHATKEPGLSLVLLPALDKACSSILHEADQQQLYLMDEPGFRRLARKSLNKPISVESIDLIASRLMAQSSLAVGDVPNQEDTMLFKLRSPKDQRTGPITITSVDCGRVMLSTTRDTLESQINEVTQSIASLRQDARHCIQTKNRHKAMFCLRKVKILDDLLEKRLGSLETIERILLKIEAAESESQILAAYEVGTTSLKTMLQQLDVDSVHATMDNLVDVLADHNEIEVAIGEGQEQILSAAAPEAMQLTEEELEKELEALLVQESQPGRVDELTQQLDGLPLPSTVEPLSGTISRRQDTEREALPAT
ncbi:hypothetical protein HDU91_002070 [Kappamyces sp. JEL0680]|nr:hypothetical protein HDU91_002070 [Kappamyces sp. JEL0680]